MPARFHAVGFRELAAHLTLLSRGPSRLFARVLFKSGKRSAEQNAGIAKRQAELGRNPWFLAPSERDAVGRRLKAALAGLQRGHLTAALVEMSTAGWLIVTRFQRHIDLQKDLGGRLAPISKETAARKRKIGQPAKALEASGELKHARTVEVGRV